MRSMEQGSPGWKLFPGGIAPGVPESGVVFAARRRVASRILEAHIQSAQDALARELQTLGVSSIAQLADADPRDMNPGGISRIIECGQAVTRAHDGIILRPENLEYSHAHHLDGRIMDMHMLDPEHIAVEVAGDRNPASVHPDVKILDITTGETVLWPLSHGHRYYGEMLGVTPEGWLVVTEFDDRQPVWRDASDKAAYVAVKPKTGETVRHPLESPDTGKAVYDSQANRIWWVRTLDRQLVWFDLHTAQLTVNRLPNAQMNHLHGVTPDGFLVMGERPSSSISLVDAASGSIVASYKPNSIVAGSVRVLPDGSITFVSGGWLYYVSPNSADSAHRLLGLGSNNSKYSVQLISGYGGGSEPVLMVSDVALPDMGRLRSVKPFGNDSVLWRIAVLGMTISSSPEIRVGPGGVLACAANEHVQIYRETPDSSTIG